MTKRWMRWLAAVATAGLVAACGGGGGGGGDPIFGGGDGDGDGPTAADLSLQLNTLSLPNSGSEAITATVTAVDASRNVIEGIPVAVSVDNDAVAAVSGATTNAAGQVTANVTIGSNRSSRLITVTAKSGSIERTATFRVRGAKLTATALPAVASVGSTGNKIIYRLTDVNESPMPDMPIVVSANGFADVTGETDANGEYQYVYRAPTRSTEVTFLATAGGETQEVEVQVGSSAKPNAIGEVLSASVSANPSVISVNTTSTDNRSELRALFLGEDNAPIENVRVRFRLPDPNSVGGTLSTGSTVVYSDVNGFATSSYRPASRSSPTNGVTVEVCYDNVDFAVGACPNKTSTTLTVVSEALGVTIGTDNTVQEGASGLTYVKRYVVLVVDAAGRAKSDVQLTASVDLTRYIKGYFDGPEAWNRDAPSLDNPVPVRGSIGFTGSTCLNEDLNRNGVLEAGEDVNRNGALDPRKSDIAVSFVGSNRTDASGSAVLQIEYPKSSATWIDYTILVAASGVAGTEGRDTYSGRLTAAAAEFEAKVPPSFVDSPYGIGLIDTNGDGTRDCRDSD